MNAAAQPILTLRHISKRFGATQALDDVSLDVYPGEVQALIGENGAGKSTLIKIITGVHQPDSGEMHLNGKPIHVRNSQEAQAYGIAAIYQEPMVFPDLSVAENIFISHRDFGPVVRWKAMYRRAEEILAQLDVHLDVRQPARGLTLAAQQVVEIAKAISLDARVLIMDEPTASLSAHEVRQLFSLVERLRKQGVAILFIGHRLEEVFEIADRITILRDGKLVASHLASEEVSVEQVIREMVGREVHEFYAQTTAELGGVVLKVENLGREGAFSGVSFEVRAGEVLGFAGLVGSRRTDVGLALFGIEPADEGRLILEGEEIDIRSSRQALERGIAYMSEDRRHLGLVMPMSITANITLPTLRNYLNGLGLVQRQKEKSVAEKFRERLSIRTPSVEAPVAQLSGGNQQKVMLAKWLNAGPKVLILDEPTRGIDVGAKAEVHQLVDELAEQGLAIIVISSDLPEVLSMCDRILVMREGRQAAIFSRDEATQELIMAAAMGQSNAVEEERP